MSTAQKFIPIYLIISLLFGEISANTPDSIFISANKAYLESEFDNAILQYEEILAQGLESSGLYYNLGNAYYKTRNYPKAILNFERALMLDPLNEDIRFNLEKSKIYNIDQIDVIPEFILKRGIKGVLEIFQSNTWAIISLFSFLAGLVCLLVYFLSLKITLKRIGFYAGIIALLISLATFFIARNTKLLLQESGGAIVMSPTVTVKGSPSSSSTDLFIIHEGTKVYIVDQLNEWFEVRLTDGKQGWIKESEIEAI